VKTGAGPDPPPVPKRRSERHRDEKPEADEEEHSAEREPVFEHPLDVAGLHDPVAALPPDVRDGERQLGDPDEREADHPEEHPGADAPGRGFAGEAVASPGIESEDDDEYGERRDPVPAQEKLVALRAVEEGGIEEPVLVDVLNLQVVRNVRRPQQVGREKPCRRSREGQDDLQRRSQAGTTGSTGSSGGSGSASAGPLNGYRSVKSQKYAVVCSP
jgi:hypothetical protein